MKTGEDTVFRPVFWLWDGASFAVKPASGFDDVNLGH